MLLSYISLVNLVVDVMWGGTWSRHSEHSFTYLQGMLHNWGGGHGAAAKGSH